MKEHDDKLTLQETEQLCRLYMDCKLSLLEETELQYVLGKLPYSTPCIDEVRVLMGLSLPKHTTAKKPVKSRYGRFSRRAAYGVAASVAVLFTIGFAMFNNRESNNFPSSDVYIAYANGEKVSRELSEEQVKSDMELADRFLRHISRLETQEQEEVENFLKQIEK